MHHRLLLPVFVAAVLAACVAAQPCTPVDGAWLNNGSDHRAHAVPGKPYRFEDHTGLGSAIISLNGSGSHSHFYDPRSGSRGRIVSYQWEVIAGTDRIFTLCRKRDCIARLPLGAYRVKLTVIDSTCDEASSTTTVTIVSGGRPGARALFYKGRTDVPIFPGRDTDAPRPDLSRTLSALRMPSAASFPADVLGQAGGGRAALSMRVLCEVNVRLAGWYSFRLECTGARCSSALDGRGGTTALFPLATGIRRAAVLLTAGTHRIAVLWRRDAGNPAPPYFALQWITPGPVLRSAYQNIPQGMLFHRPGILPPVVHFVTPHRARPDRLVRVYGSSFVAPLRVFLSGVPCAAPRVLNQYIVTCRLVGFQPGTKRVVVTTRAGRSNDNVKLDVIAEDATKGTGYTQPVRFTTSPVTHPNGKKWRLADATSVALGPDGRYYFGLQWGAVLVAEIDRAKVTYTCASGQIANRSVLGLAFNPAQPGTGPGSMKLYATLSSLFWKTRLRMPQATGWHNGEVGMFKQRIRPEGGVCMYYVRPVITGLPVSNYDHSVNKIAFDNAGRMYVTIGSNTNAGVRSPEFGDVDDALFSGSVIVAPILSPGFDGRVRYLPTGAGPATARKASGDVSLYATGLRNSFGIVYHSSGSLFATDNGGNQAFGARSTGCRAEDEVPPNNERDKLVRLRPGGFYGAANRYRGSRGQPRQCVHRRSGPDNKVPDWDKPILGLDAASTGLVEYTAATFGGRLQGDLFVTQLATADSDGKVLRVALDAEAKNVASVDLLAPASGLDAAITPVGDLVMPRVYRKAVIVMRALEVDPGILAVISVNPARGPRKGGYELIVTGWGFGTNGSVGVAVGGRPCLNVRRIGLGHLKGRQVVCTAPAAGLGKKSVAVVVTRGSASSKSLGNDFRYMAV